MVYNLSKLVLVLLWFIVNLAYAQTQPPKLVCAVPQPNGDVVLTWQPQPFNCGPVYIYASTNRNGPYTLLATVPLNPPTYTHIGANASSQIWYYYITDDPSCNGPPALSSDTLDSQQPQPPIIRSVSVESNDSVLIRWYPSSEPDAYAYVIYVYDSVAGNFLPLDTVPHPVDSYWHTIFHPLRPVEASQHPETYTVALMDSCGTIGPLQDSTHTTIFLTTTIDRCKEQAIMVWTRYGGYNPNDYTAYWTINNQPNSQNVQTDTIFYISLEREGDTLCTRVNATVPPDIVSSNRICQITEFVKSPDIFKIMVATVELDSAVKLIWYVDSTADLARMVIRRQEYKNNSPLPIVNIPWTKQSTFTYIDSLTDPTIAPVYYIIEAEDSCGRRYITDNHAQTVHLKVKSSQAFVNFLQWTKYQQWTGNTRIQYILRSIDNGDWQVIYTLDSSTTSLTDEIRTRNSESGLFCYRICVEEENNPFISDLQACSPPICDYQKAVIYVPNAFNPETGSLFKPIMRYDQWTQYEFRIYNRYGQIVFRTTKPTEGWDGTYRGNQVPSGTYTYQIIATHQNGTEYAKSGFFVVVYPNE
ncbi:MAG: gliding motility-associated C-terminal domain-containing protein [Chlorobi bacterium]|nr:gliding motility-associated C-terminal domain-containing protein [Chlorobiota bacterium]